MPQPKYDFFSPFFSAAILCNDPAVPGRFPLSWPAEALPEDLAAKAGVNTYLPYLSSLTVDLQLAWLPKITAVLTPPVAEAVDFLNSPLVEYGRSSLEVQFGYTNVGNNLGAASPKFVGLMLQPEISLGLDATITLVGQGIGGFSGTQTCTNIDPKEQTRIQVIKHLVAGPSKDHPRPTKVVLEEVEKDKNSRAYKLLVEEKITPVQAGFPDWFYIWKLVRECECWMIEINDELRIFPYSSSMRKEPKYTLAFPHYFGGRNAVATGDTGQFGPAAGRFPILSVTSQTKAMYISGIRGLVLRGTDPNTRKPVQEILDDKSVKIERTGIVLPNGDSPAAAKDSSAAPAANKDTGGGLTFFPGNPSTPGLYDTARAELANLALAMGIGLEIETEGMPDIYPGDSLLVDGLGIRYDGKYCVMNVSHMLSGAGFKTKLTLRSNVQDTLAAYERAEQSVLSTKMPEKNGGTTKETVQG